MEQVNPKEALADLAAPKAPVNSSAQTAGLEAAAEEIPAGMAIPTTQPTVDAAKPSVDGYELPTGYLDVDGNIHKEAWVREMTGEEEDILTARKVKIHQRMGQILERCVTQIGAFRQGDMNWPSVIKGLTVSDRLFLMIKIRQVSLGNLFSFKVKCTDEVCGKMSEQTVDLQDFKIGGMPNPSERVFEIELPKTKKKAKLKIQTGADEGRIANFVNLPNPMTIITMSRLLELDGNNKVTIEMVKKLPSADMDAIRKAVKEHEGDIDNEIDVTCPHCGNEFKTDINVGSPTFFFPSAT